MDDNNNINNKVIIKTSDIILSNLGADGILFAYDYEPEPINE